MKRTVSFAALSVLLPACALTSPWPRHVIDDTSRGADGVRLADINGDGRLDIATGWEEGGVIRVYIQPPQGKVRRPWPRVTVGRVGSPEDACFFDVNGDGVLDVVSCCEGSTRTVFFHKAPRDRARLLDPSAWETKPFPATAGRAMWMFALPLQVDGRNGLDLVIGAKGRGASISYLAAPRRRADLSAWKSRRLSNAGWIMSLEASDVDGDGDTDIILSDRKGRERGVFWLENPGGGATTPAALWARHPIGAVGREVMFLWVSKTREGRVSCLLATYKPYGIVRLTPLSSVRRLWEATPVCYDPQGHTGTVKAVCEADFNGDGRKEIAVTCEQAKGRRSGVFLLERRSRTGSWAIRDVSGPRGIKYDLVVPIDLDGDGDKDILTCEERQLNAVVWYENPSK